MVVVGLVLVGLGLQLVGLVLVMAMLQEDKVPVDKDQFLVVVVVVVEEVEVVQDLMVKGQHQTKVDLKDNIQVKDQVKDQGPQVELLELLELLVHKLVRNGIPNR